MDHVRDYPRVKTLVTRLCETLNKPVTDELVESWWKALRDLDYQPVADRVDDFIARAGEKTQFPRPRQMRPEGHEPPAAGQVVGNPTRDFWRSCIVYGVAKDLGHMHVTLEPLVIAHKDTMGRAMRDLLNDLSDQDAREGRSHGLHVGCYRRCREIAIAFKHLALEGAPVLFEPNNSAA